MAIELLFELVADLGAGASKPNDTELSKLLKSLDPGRQRAVLEVLTAAALDDGKVTGAEREMLARRSEDTSRELAYDTVSVVTEAMPFATGDELVAFISRRIAPIASREQRERVLFACLTILNAAGAPDVREKHALFARGLDVPQGRYASIDAAARAGAQAW